MNDNQKLESLAIAEQAEVEEEFRPSDDDLADADYCLAYPEAGHDADEFIDESDSYGRWCR